MRPVKVSTLARFLDGHPPTSVRQHLDAVQIYGDKLVKTVQPLMSSAQRDFIKERGITFRGFRSNDGVGVFEDVWINRNRDRRLDKIRLTAQASSPQRLLDLHGVIDGQYKSLNAVEFCTEVGFPEQAEADELRSLVRQFGYLPRSSGVPFQVGSTDYAGGRADERQLTVYSNQPSKIGTAGAVCRIQIALKRDALKALGLRQLPDLVELLEGERIVEVFERHLEFTEFSWNQVLERCNPILAGPNASPRRQAAAEYMLQILQRNMVAVMGDTMATMHVFEESLSRADVPWFVPDIPMQVQRDFIRRGFSLADAPDSSRDPDVYTTVDWLRAWAESPEKTQQRAYDHGVGMDAPPIRHRMNNRFGKRIDLFALLGKYAGHAGSHINQGTSIRT